jgi:hypothetical protein
LESDLNVGIKDMNRKILAFILAPSPVITVLLLLCLCVLLSPVQIIDGKADNAPYRAAMIIPIMIPFFFYPALLIMFALQTFLTKRIKVIRLRGHLFSGIAISILVSALLAARTYAPHLNESFLLTWIICFIIWSVLSVSMTLTWWFIRGKCQQKDGQIFSESALSEKLSS